MNIENEPLVRGVIFLLLAGGLITWEILKPRRQNTLPKTQRWRINFSLMVIDILLLRALFPLAAVGIALYSSEKNWGLFNRIELNPVLLIIITVLLLDLLIYWQHRLFHKIPWLWRLHRIHHTDLELDISSGVRFHPLEIILSMLIKTGFIIIFGLSPVGVLIFEIILNSTAMFNHSNIYIKPTIDRYLRWFIITPDMHRIHHSTVIKETDSNFGFNLPWWDRLFKSYCAEPHGGQTSMPLGLTEFRDAGKLRLRDLLWLPMKNKNSINTS